MNAPDLTRLCIHTATTKQLPLGRAVDAYAAHGVSGITVWDDALEPYGPAEARRMIESAGLSVVSLCRGGFFVSPEAVERTESIQHNTTLIHRAAELGAPLLVLVCGAHPDVPLESARAQITGAIERLLPIAAQCGVKLAVEPLHPMYADSRSAITTLRSANELVEGLDSEDLGIALDVYHLWWDPELPEQISRCGSNIAAFHVSDWRSPTRHLLTDRALMGEGCIPIREIRHQVEKAGFGGFIEVEIFSEELWAVDQREYVKAITRAYIDHA